jgi:beta-phosphoglucomutase-like phosphatase (HAD superfamily)
VVTGDDVKNSKPDPDPFLKAVELLNVRRDECIIVENAILGVEAAKKAEIYCIGVPTYLEPSQLNRADVIVGDHKKLIEHLLSLEPSLRFRI